MTEKRRRIIRYLTYLLLPPPSPPLASYKLVTARSRDLARKQIKRANYLLPQEKLPGFYIPVDPA